MLQTLYILPLSAASAVAFNEHHRFLFLCSLTATAMREYGGNIHFVCLEAQDLAKKQFKVFYYAVRP